MKSVIIIPTLNPENKIIDLVKDLQKEGFDKIAIVDDGSREEFSSIFKELESLGCMVTHHEVNKGKGQAIKTGINFVNDNYNDFVGYVTVDGDYQHLPKDVKNVALKMEEDDSKIVLGERSFKDKNVPIKSRIGNGFSTLFFKLQNGVYVEDTQTGLRGIPRRYKDFALKVEGERYEYEMNFLKDAVSNKIAFEMVRIQTVYEDNNKGTHFRPLKDAYLIYKEPVKYIIIAILSFIIDISLFAFFNNFLFKMILAYISVSVITALSSILARILSGTFNFFMNKIVAFKSKGETKKQFIKYVILFLAQMGVSTSLVTIASYLPINIVVFKIIVDTGIFVVNYFIQKRFIFE